MMYKDSLHIRIWFLLILFNGIWSNSSLAQLPNPESFCSHAKSSIENSRQASVDYAYHDLYDVHFYHLNIWAETENTFLRGMTKIQAQTITELDTVYLEFTKNLRVDSVLVNNKKCSFTHTSDDILFFSPPETFAASSNFEILVYYQGTAVSEGGRGYNSANSYQGTRVNWTLSEPFYSKDWWPCKQELEDKADSVWVFVTTSAKNKVGSNGLLTNSVALADEKVRYEWKSRYPIAYYLISFAMAEYMEYSFESISPNGKHVWMLNYMYPDSVLFKNQKTLIDCTQVQMNLLQEKYGEYPFIEEKYGHCITPIGGGMEHQTMTTQNSFQFHLTIHEMGHSWFGNHVTCAKWNDIWINEGFATYSQYLGVENLLSRESADAYMAAIQSIVMDEPDGSVFVPEEQIEDRDRIFSGRLSYYKGATIIHMIRYLLNDDELFFHVLQEFQIRYAYQTATGEDFRGVLEDISGKDFQNFFDLWYYGEGFPIYYFEWTQSADLIFNLLSFQESSTPETSFFDMKYDVRVFFTDGTDTLLQIHQENAEEDIKIKFRKLVKAVVPNPKSWNLMEVRSVYSGLSIPGKVKLEPNPAQDFVMIRFANALPQRIISIYNSSLQLIEETEATQKYFRQDLRHLPAGIYFIDIIEGQNRGTYKLIKF